MPQSRSWPRSPAVSRSRARRAHGSDARVLRQDDRNLEIRGTGLHVDRAGWTGVEGGPDLEVNIPGVRHIDDASPRGPDVVRDALHDARVLCDPERQDE